MIEAQHRISTNRLVATRDDQALLEDFAARARAIAAQAIHYASLRDPGHRANVALLDPAAFASATPTVQQTWHFRYEAGQLTAFPSSERHAFTFATFGPSSS